MKRESQPNLAQLRDQAASTLGAAAVEDLRPLAGGASRALWAFDATIPGADPVPLVLLDTDDTAEREWQALRAAHANGVAVAEPLWRTPDGEGIVMRRLPGEAIPTRIFRHEALAGGSEQLLDQVAAALAGIHGTALEQVPAAGETGGALAELDELERELRGYGDPYPTLELGLRWLRANLPPERGPTLIHGDFRMGNMLIEGERLIAVLDWELVHAGNPIMDLGYFCIRSWRFGKDERPAAGLGSRQRLLDAYSAAGGARIEIEELRFWEALGNLRWGVYSVRQLHGHLSGQRPSLELAAIGRRTCEAEWDLLAMIP